MCRFPQDSKCVDLNVGVRAEISRAPISEVDNVNHHVVQSLTYTAVQLFNTSREKRYAACHVLWMADVRASWHRKQGRQSVIGKMDRLFTQDGRSAIRQRTFILGWQSTCEHIAG